MTDVKISALPLGTASGTGANDVFPYVDVIGVVTNKLKLSDLINLPSMTSTYAPLASPTFSGTVTGTFSGNISGNATTATSATTATNATNTGITDDSATNATMYPTWVTTTSGNLPQKISSTKLTFNPSTATLTTTTFSGALSGNATTATTATNSTNIAVTDDSATNATMYPLWVTTTSGNLPAKLSSTKMTFNPSTATLTTTNFAGTATNSTNVGVTDDSATNATMYPLWVTTTSGNLPAKLSSTKMTFNPSTATLTTTTFSGALSGNATTATTATNATNTGITDDSATNATMYPTWVTTTSGNLPQKISSTKLTFNPSTATLTTTTFSGALSGNATTATSATTATNATNTGITDDSATNATMYPTWVTTTTGNLPQKISSTKLTFNPSTATLTTTTFSGALSGNATTATTATNISALTTQGDILYGGASGASTRLAQGTANQLLGFQGSNTSPSYMTINQDVAKNYINANPDAEVDTTGWATYSDGAQNTPVDATGGSATNLTFSRSTSTPLRGTASFSMVQANSTSIQGKGVSYAFTIDSADQARVLQISFDYNASSTFVAGNGITAPLNDGTVTTNAGNSDVEIFIYDVTNAVLIPVSPQTILANGSNNFRYIGKFQTASNSTSYRLAFHVATASANATGWTFKFDNVFVGAQTSAIGTSITDWTAYTPTFTGFGTPSAVYGEYRRVGNSIQVRADCTVGTSTGVAVKISLPTGLTIDTSAMTGNPSRVTIGIADRILNGSTYATTGYGPWPVFSDGSDLTNVFIAIGTGGTGSATAFAKQLGNTVMGTGEGFCVFFEIPILGWASSSVMSSDTDTRVVAAIVTGDPASATSGNPIIVPTTTIDTHGAYSGSTGRYTVPVSGIYKMYGSLQSASSATTLTIYKNAVSTSLAGNLDSNGEATFISAVNCVAGDIIDLRPGGTVDATNMTLNIERLSGPASVISTDSISARYYASATSISGSLATVSWTTKDYDSHGGMSSGTYTIPVAGKYQINSAVRVAATFAAGNASILEIQKNSTVVSRNTNNAGGIQGDAPVECSDIISCLAGDTIRIQVSSAGTSPSIVSSNFDNFFSIMRLGN